MQVAWAGGRRVVVITLLLVAAFLAQGAVVQSAHASTRSRDTMLRLTNHDRSEHHEASLSLNAKLSRYALRHSRRMAEKGYLFHTIDLADRLKGLDWSIGGENVGVGSTLHRVERGFMRSTPHR
ncbi:MAG TPA: CAP domain-containing protein, partial [Actinomycetota bacterium]|nr:CAP domain-containing protein [Actinomycetota bacterium]